MLDTELEPWETIPEPPPAAEETIPAGLDTLEPGPVLAAFLASVDVSKLSGLDQLVVLAAMERQISHNQARLFETMAAVVDSVIDEYDMDMDQPMTMYEAVDAAVAEVRVALHLTRRAADREMEFAMELHNRLPQVRAALRNGALDRRRAGVFVYETTHLTIAAAREVADRILPLAATLTAGQLRSRIQRLCLEMEPDQAAKRYNASVADRRVIVQPSPDGTADLLGLNLPPDKVAEVRDRIEKIAGDLRGDNETRTMDQLRADVYLDLLTGAGTGSGSTGTRRGVIDLRIDLRSLTGLTDTPGELNGYGPVIADIARRVVDEHPDSEWRYTVTDPDNGQTVSHGTTRRRPSATQRRAVQSRDETCAFPGCRMPATRSDLDHRIPYSQGGSTTVDQLAPLCRRDHCIKHDFGWTYRRLPNGEYEWTSPFGLKTQSPGTDRAP